MRIKEVRLFTNSLSATERFWIAIDPLAEVKRGRDALNQEWVRIAPRAGTALLITAAPTAQHVTTVVMTARVDAGAAKRLRAAGSFELSASSTSATDLGSGTTVHFEFEPPAQGTAERTSDGYAPRRGDLVRMTTGGRVYKVIRLRRDGWAYLSTDAEHIEAAKRLPASNTAYDPRSLIVESHAAKAFP